MRPSFGNCFRHILCVQRQNKIVQTPCPADQPQDARGYLKWFKIKGKIIPQLHQMHFKCLVEHFHHRRELCHTVPEVLNSGTLDILGWVTAHCGVCSAACVHCGMFNSHQQCPLPVVAICSVCRLCQMSPGKGEQNHSSQNHSLRLGLGYTV